MTGGLHSLDAVLAEALDGVSPIAAMAVTLDTAIGQRLAADVWAAAPVPPAMIALREGLAVSSLDLVGATLHAPVALLERPVMVSVGDAMPPGCDAVLDPAAVTMTGPFAEVTESIAPGTWVRRAGHDLAAGAIIATAGTVLTPEAGLAAKLSGVAQVQVRRLDVALDWPPGPEREWLSQRLAAFGIVPSSQDAASAHLMLRPASGDNHLVALMPGAAFSLTRQGSNVIMAMPSRFDGVVGAWCAVVLPVLAQLLDGVLPTRMYRLTRKIASSVGMAEVALLRTTGNHAEPLAVGDLTLAAIAASDAFAVIPAGAEGHATGSELMATAFAAPLVSPLGTPV